MSVETELKELIVSRFKSIRQFSNEINIPATTIQSMLNSGIENAGVKKVMKICDFLGIDTDALADGYIKERKANPIDITVFEYELIKKYRSLIQPDKKAVDDLLDNLSSRRREHHQEFMVIQPPLSIPYFGHIASAGTGQFVYDDLPPEMIELEYEMDNMEVDYAIGVNGDSMEPTYSDGDILLIKKQERINIGDIGIFMIDGEAYVKELGNRKLISHNKKYSDISINESVTCLGKAIGKYIK